MIVTNRVNKKQIAKWFRPLEQLSEKIPAIAEGQLDVVFNEEEVSSEIHVLQGTLNETTQTLKLYIDDLEGWYSDPITIPANDWVGFLSDDEGRFQVESIKNGDFKAVLE